MCDAAGNLVKKGNQYQINKDTVTFTATSGEGVEYWEYTYDLLDRLTGVAKNGTVVADYGYSPEGLREVKRSAGVTTHYVFEGTEPLFEKRISDGRIRSYVYALGKHLARVDGAIGDPDAKIYYYHTDQVGSVKAVTDQSGNEVYNADYMPFGSRFEKEGEFDETHGFTGKEYDSDAGLYYFNARWYDSETGRFIAEDPAADPNNPNLYSYCTNNPLIFIDPTGKDYWKNGSPVWDWMHNTNEDINAWLESPDRWWNQSEGYDGRELLYKRDSGAYFEQWEKQTSQLFGTNIMFGVDPLSEYSKLTGSRQIDPQKYSFKNYVNDMGPLWEAKYKSRTAAGVASDLFEVASMIYLASEGKNFLKSAGAYLEAQGISKSEAAIEKIESTPAKTLFRGERSSMNPDVVFTNGFLPKGTSNDLEKHISSNTTAGNFVSTSSSREIAQGFAGKNGYVYVIETSNYIDVNKTLGSKVPYLEQQEFSIHGGISPNQIKGAYVMKNGIFTGEYIPNPNYNGGK